MATAELQQVERSWPTLAPVLFVPHSEQDYDRLVGILDNLTDIVGEDESHPLASLMEVIGVLVERYEDDNVPEIADLAN